MKITILNLPFKNKIVRRYKCTYNSSTFLLPPLELLYIASSIYENNEINFIDCIAENINLYDLQKIIKDNIPDIIITMMGIESLDYDMESLKSLKKDNQSTQLLITGYLPTIFPEEFIKKDYIDFIVSGESEWSIKKLIDNFGNIDNYKEIENLSYKKNGEFIINNNVVRLENLDNLKFPARFLINNSLYSEPMSSKPFTTVLTSRGCSYNCPYCVSTYGKKVHFRTIENVIDELKEIVNEYGINNIRFMDDTLTISKERIISLCQNIIKEKLDFNWSCLSRPDLIDNEILEIMKKAGCFRIYMGIESGSDRILKFFNRKYSIKDIKQRVNLIKKYNIEISGFFIAGGPFESNEDFQKTLKLVGDLNCDYYILDHLTPYPATKLFEKFKNKIEFSLFPYKNQYRDEFIEKIYHKREKEFYNKAYFNPNYIKNSLKRVIKHPREAFINFKSLSTYLKKNKTNKKYI